MLKFIASFRGRHSSLFALPIVFLTLVTVSPATLRAVSIFAPIPTEVSSNHFMVTINGDRTPVMHAAGGYYLLNFEVTGSVQLTVTASDPHYWDSGVEVQPMRHGIRPVRQGASITFPLSGPAKLSITRPGDHFSESEMLFLFANEPDHSGITATTPGVRYYGPGVHHENIDAHTGDNIYLAAGAVVFGALNIWQVDNVHVSGLGTIIYDGPQDPNHDEGWMHKPNWHVIVLDDAQNIDIEGITGIVRSRTWMVQMRDSRHVKFRNVKILGNTTGNANQDGIDWLGGGDTLVQDSFFRASDDIFAMYGNWDGYTQEALTSPGHEVSNILIENTVLSTSISNIVRLGWPRKIFESHNFTLRDSDVMHMGIGGCTVPFALFEMWADPGGKGRHSGYHFEDIRLEDWYSLVQLRQPNPSIRDVTFTNIAAMDGPGMVPSVFKGSVAGVAFRGVDLGGGEVQKDSDIPLEILEGAVAPSYESGASRQAFTYSEGLIKPGRDVLFQASGTPGLTYHWMFGDGTSADGSSVHHTFPDTQGTLLDGSGRFRVLLRGTDATGKNIWSSQSIVVANEMLPEIAGVKAPGIGPGLAVTGQGKGIQQGFLSIPANGGYTLTLLTSTTASLMVDGKVALSLTPRPQVCEAEGNAVQPVSLSLSLARGLHTIRIERGLELENANTSAEPLLLWEGPAIPRQPIPASAYLHKQ